MGNDVGTPKPVFHAGEVALQREAGVAERMARVGSQMIRRYMPEQHREFFGQLPFIVVGSVDERGLPTASLLRGEPGFVSSPEPTTLRVDAPLLAGDPLELNRVVGSRLGLLGIQPHARRRNRLNGKLVSRDAHGLLLEVEQSFGNCPKYIHPRQVSHVVRGWSGRAQSMAGLDRRGRALIEAADTFFIASAHPEATASDDPAHGVDVSHRGGPPGFAQFVADATFIVPDYPGNNLYNTLGNLTLNPFAGLLFIDPTTADVLSVHAAVEIRAGSHPQAHPERAERVLSFRSVRSHYWAGASDLHFE